MDTFYIIEVFPGRFQGRLKETHYCFSCGASLETILNTIRSYVIKYKTQERLYRAFRRCEDRGEAPPKVFATYMKEYAEGKHLDYVALVSKTVREALEYNREYNKEHSIAKTIKKVIRIVPKSTEDVQAQIGIMQEMQEVKVTKIGNRVKIRLLGST